MKTRIGSGRLSTKAQMVANGFAEVSDGAALVKAPRGRPEAAIQRAIIDRLRWAGILAIHIPNEGKRTAITGRRLKGEGMRPGFPDLICYQHGHHALLEVKAPKGRTSDAQRECHAELGRHGFTVAVVTSQDEAVEALRARGFRL